MTKDIWKIRNGVYGQREVSDLLKDGWEPFAVTRSDQIHTDTVWLRRKERVIVKQKAITL